MHARSLKGLPVRGNTLFSSAGFFLATSAAAVGDCVVWQDGGGRRGGARDGRGGAWASDRVWVLARRSVPREEHPEQALVNSLRHRKTWPHASCGQRFSDIGEEPPLPPLHFLPCHGHAAMRGCDEARNSKFFFSSFLASACAGIPPPKHFTIGKHVVTFERRGFYSLAPRRILRHP